MKHCHKKHGVLIALLAIIGIITVAVGIAYAVQKYLCRDDDDEWDFDFDDDDDNDEELFFEDEEDFEE